MYARHPEMAKKWEKETPKDAKLPEKVKEEAIGNGWEVEFKSAFNRKIKRNGGKIDLGGYWFVAEPEKENDREWLAFSVVNKKTKKPLRFSGTYKANADGAVKFVKAVMKQNRIKDLRENVKLNESEFRQMVRKEIESILSEGIKKGSYTYSIKAKSIKKRYKGEDNEYFVMCAYLGGNQDLLKKLHASRSHIWKTSLGSSLTNSAKKLGISLKIHEADMMMYPGKPVYSVGVTAIGDEKKIKSLFSKKHPIIVKLLRDIK